MHFPLHLLYPLASSIGYVFAVLFLKRSAAFGVGVLRTTFVSNLAVGLCFAPLWLLGGRSLVGAPWWQPALVAAIFFLGQIFTFLAIRGDISVATPVLGVKIILVACFSSLMLAEPVPLLWWTAAGLSTVALALLHRGISGSGQGVGRTIALAGLAASAFALNDVLVQKWTPEWGAGRFFPVMFALLVMFSVLLIPMFKSPLRAIPRPGWRWLLPGTALLALQASSITFGIGVHGEATAMNVVYASRGLWSVLAVWLIGRWFQNEERQVGPAVLRARLLGAGLMLVAIVLVLLE